MASKISKLIGFFNLVFGELNEEEKAILEEKLIKTYNIKEINFDDNSLYKIIENNFLLLTKLVFLIGFVF